MNSRPVLSSMCRACGQRTTKSTSGARRQRLPSSSPITHMHLALRPLTTTTHSQIQPVNDITLSSSLPAAELTPTSMPPSVTTIARKPKHPFPQKQSPQEEEEQPKQKLFIATITSIHNLTAHATYTKQFWDPVFRKHYTKPQHVLVHDPFPAHYGLSTRSATTSQPSTPSEVGRLHTPTSLLRVGDVISLRPIRTTTTNISGPTSERDAFFSTLELNRKLKTAGKHKKQVVNDHMKAMAKQAKTTRSSRGVRFEVKEVLTPFGEGFEERVAKARGERKGIVQEAEGAEIGLLGGIDGTTVVGGERMAWWKRRELRGDIGKARKDGKK